MTRAILMGECEASDLQTRTGRIVRDWQIAVALALVAATISHLLAQRIDPRVYDTFNILFQADSPRVISNMTDRFSRWQNATSAHPLFPILTLPLVKLLERLGMAPLQSVQLLLAAAAAASTGLVFLAARGLQLPRWPAVALAGVFLSSATFLHWYAIPETFGFAGFTVMLMLTVAIRRGERAGLPWLLASAGTLAITITNWSVALLAGAFMLPLRRQAMMAAGAFLLVLFLAALQSHLFPRAYIFLNPGGLERAGRYTGFTMHHLGMEWSPLASLKSALATSAVAPIPVIATTPTDFGPFTLVTNQFVSLAAMPVAGLAALMLWAFMLLVGCWSAMVDRPRRKIGLLLLSFVASQVAFHVIYGEITFLYAADFFPGMVLLIAFGWLSRARRAVEVAMLVFIPLAAFNNVTQFDHAAKLAHMIAVEKSEGLASGAF